MLFKILEAHGGHLPPDVHVLFANTGKEREETLQFVYECGQRWGVPIIWLEYTTDIQPGMNKSWGSWKVVDVNSASRNGEPFQAMIKSRGYTPNPVTRCCTEVLKIRPLTGWAKKKGYTDWTQVIGLRADEPRRVSRMKTGRNLHIDKTMPMACAGVSERDVMDFWIAQPFDLGLTQGRGNCDLCFLKGFSKILSAVEDQPRLADWWERMEVESGHTFHKDRPTYGQIKNIVSKQQVFPFMREFMEDTVPCFCAD